MPNANLIIKNATKSYQNGDISYVEYVQSLETASQIQNLIIGKRFIITIKL